MRDKKGLSPIRKLNKSGQEIMGMSFGVIFSIFLIVIFIVFAFIAIKHFLGLRDCSEVGMFYDELQKEVTGAWSSSYKDNSANPMKINVPSGIKTICFGNLSDTGTLVEDDNYNLIMDYGYFEESGANLFLIPPEEGCDMPFKKIKNLNITKTIEMNGNANPYCFDVKDNGIVIIKEFYGDVYLTDKELS